MSDPSRALFPESASKDPHLKVEQDAVRPPVAAYPSLARRLASMAYESLAVAAIVIAGGFAFAGAAAALKLLAGSPAATDGSAIERALLQGVLVALLGGYFIRSWVRGGQTLAMKAWRLRLVRPDGRGIELRRALARFLLAGLPLASGTIAAIWLWTHPQSGAAWLGLAPAAVDLAWALADRAGQFLHDRLAGTRVVLVDKPAR